MGCCYLVVRVESVGNIEVPRDASATVVDATFGKIEPINTLVEVRCGGRRQHVGFCCDNVLELLRKGEVADVEVAWSSRSVQRAKDLEEEAAEAALEQGRDGADSVHLDAPDSDSDESEAGAWIGAETTDTVSVPVLRRQNTRMVRDPTAELSTSDNDAAHHHVLHDVKRNLLTYSFFLLPACSSVESRVVLQTAARAASTRKAIVHCAEQLSEAALHGQSLDEALDAASEISSGSSSTGSAPSNGRAVAAVASAAQHPGFSAGRRPAPGEAAKAARMTLPQLYPTLPPRLRSSFFGDMSKWTLVRTVEQHAPPDFSPIDWLRSEMQLVSPTGNPHHNAAAGAGTGSGGGYNWKRDHLAARRDFAPNRLGHDFRPHFLPTFCAKLRRCPALANELEVCYWISCLQTRAARPEWHAPDLTLSARSGSHFECALLHYALLRSLNQYPFLCSGTLAETGESYLWVATFERGGTVRFWEPGKCGSGTSVGAKPYVDLERRVAQVDQWKFAWRNHRGRIYSRVGDMAWTASERLRRRLLFAQQTAFLFHRRTEPVSAPSEGAPSQGGAEQRESSWEFDVDRKRDAHVLLSMRRKELERRRKTFKTAPNATVEKLLAEINEVEQFLSVQGDARKASLMQARNKLAADAGADPDETNRMKIPSWVNVQRKLILQNSELHEHTLVYTDIFLDGLIRRPEERQSQTSEKERAAEAQRDGSDEPILPEDDVGDGRFLHAAPFFICWDCATSRYFYGGTEQGMRQVLEPLEHPDPRSIYYDLWDQNYWMPYSAVDLIGGFERGTWWNDHACALGAARSESWRSRRTSEITSFLRKKITESRSRRRLDTHWEQSPAVVNYLVLGLDLLRGAQISGCASDQALLDVKRRLRSWRSKLVQKAAVAAGLATSVGTVTKFAESMVGRNRILRTLPLRLSDCRPAEVWRKVEFLAADLINIATDGAQLSVAVALDCLPNSVVAVYVFLLALVPPDVHRLAKEKERAKLNEKLSSSKVGAADAKNPKEKATSARAVPTVRIGDQQRIRLNAVLPWRKRKKGDAEESDSESSEEDTAEGAGERGTGEKVDDVNAGTATGARHRHRAHTAALPLILEGEDGDVEVEAMNAGTEGVEDTRMRNMVGGEGQGSDEAVLETAEDVDTIDENGVLVRRGGTSGSKSSKSRAHRPRHAHGPEGWHATAHGANIEVIRDTARRMDEKAKDGNVVFADHELLPLPLGSIKRACSVVPKWYDPYDDYESGASRSEPKGISNPDTFLACFGNRSGEQGREVVFFDNYAQQDHKDKRKFSILLEQPEHDPAGVAEGVLQPRDRIGVMLALDPHGGKNSFNKRSHWIFGVFVNGKLVGDLIRDVQPTTDILHRGVFGVVNLGGQAKVVKLISAIHDYKACPYFLRDGNAEKERVRRFLRTEMDGWCPLAASGDLVFKSNSVEASEVDLELEKRRLKDAGAGEGPAAASNKPVRNRAKQLVLSAVRYDEVEVNPKDARNEKTSAGGASRHVYGNGILRAGFRFFEVEVLETASGQKQGDADLALGFSTVDPATGAEDVRGPGQTHLLYFDTGTGVVRFEAPTHRQGTTEEAAASSAPVLLPMKSLQKGDSVAMELEKTGQDEDTARHLYRAAFFVNRRCVYRSEPFELAAAEVYPLLVFGDTGSVTRVRLVYPTALEEAPSGRANLSVAEGIAKSLIRSAEGTGALLPASSHAAKDAHFSRFVPLEDLLAPHSRTSSPAPGPAVTVRDDVINAAPTTKSVYGAASTTGAARWSGLAIADGYFLPVRIRDTAAPYFYFEIEVLAVDESMRKQLKDQRAKQQEEARKAWLTSPEKDVRNAGVAQLIKEGRHRAVVPSDQRPSKKNGSVLFSRLQKFFFAPAETAGSTDDERSGLVMQHADSHIADLRADGAPALGLAMSCAPHLTDIYRRKGGGSDKSHFQPPHSVMLRGNNFARSGFVEESPQKLGPTSDWDWLGLKKGDSIGLCVYDSFLYVIVNGAVTAGYGLAAFLHPRVRSGGTPASGVGLPVLYPLLDLGPSCYVRSVRLRTPPYPSSAAASAASMVGKVLTKSLLPASPSEPPGLAARYRRNDAATAQPHALTHLQSPADHFRSYGRDHSHFSFSRDRSSYYIDHTAREAGQAGRGKLESVAERTHKAGEKSEGLALMASERPLQLTKSGHLTYNVRVNALDGDVEFCAMDGLVLGVVLGRDFLDSSSVPAKAERRVACLPDVASPSFFAKFKFEGGGAKPAAYWCSSRNRKETLVARFDREFVRGHEQKHFCLRPDDILTVEVDANNGAMALFHNEEVLQMSPPGLIPVREFLSTTTGKEGGGLQTEFRAVFDLSAAKGSSTSGGASSTRAEAPENQAADVISASFIEGELPVELANQRRIFREVCGPIADPGFAPAMAFFDSGVFHGRYLRFSDDPKSVRRTGMAGGRGGGTGCGAICDGPIPYDAILGGLFFQVEATSLAPDKPEGLTIGVTTAANHPLKMNRRAVAFPARSSDLDPSWCVGFDGKVWHGGISQFSDISKLWQPGRDLKKGDRLGLFVAMREMSRADVKKTFPATAMGSVLPDKNESKLYPGQLCLVLNATKLITVAASNLPIDRDLFGVVDLLGNCEAVDFVNEPGGIPWQPRHGPLTDEDRELLANARADLHAREQASGVAEKDGFLLPLSKDVKLSSNDKIAEFIGRARKNSNHEMTDSGHNRCHLLTGKPVPFDRSRNAWCLAVRVEKMRDDGFYLDGLTLGLVIESASQYLTRREIPDSIEELQLFCAAGFDGSTFCASQQFHDDVAQFHPSVDLHHGDVVLFCLQAGSGTISLIVNRQTLLVRAKGAPPGEIVSLPGVDDGSKMKPALSAAHAVYHGVAELRGGMTRVALLSHEETLKASKEALEFASSANVGAKSPVVRAREAREKAERRHQRLRNWGVDETVIEILQCCASTPLDSCDSPGKRQCAAPATTDEVSFSTRVFHVGLRRGVRGIVFFAIIVGGRGELGPLEWAPSAPRTIEQERTQGPAPGKKLAAGPGRVAEGRAQAIRQSGNRWRRERGFLVDALRRRRLNSRALKSKRVR
eukprot:g13158.t1